MLKNKMLINSINRFYKCFHIDNFEMPSRYIQYHASVTKDVNELMSILYDVHETIYEGAFALSTKDTCWLKRLYNHLQDAIESTNIKHLHLAEQLNKFFEDNFVSLEVDSTDFRTLSGKAKWLDYLMDMNTTGTQKFIKAINNL
jgi:hypothetical protein